MVAPTGVSLNEEIGFVSINSITYSPSIRTNARMRAHALSQSQADGEDVAAGQGTYRQRSANSVGGML